MFPNLCRTRNSNVLSSVLSFKTWGLGMFGVRQSSEVDEAAQAEKPAEAAELLPREGHRTFHPPLFEMACIVAVQAMNSADWAVILPIDTYVARFLGQGELYASWLVAILYVPFPASLYMFRLVTNTSYKWAYDAWSASVVLGNALFVLLLIRRPPGVVYLLLGARMVQGLGQCVSYTNKQVLALVTSYDVRNKHMASLGSGNIAGNATGAMLCAVFVTFLGQRVEVAHTPLYLVSGALSVGALALVAGIVMHFGHPHHIQVVPERYRLQPGGARMGFAGNVSTEDSRRLRVVATNVLGFLRITNRAAWQTVSLYLLMREFDYSMLHACAAYSAVVILAMFTQQWFGQVQYLLADEAWVRLSEIVSAVSTLGMFRFSLSRLSRHAASYQFILASIVFYSGMSVNSNVTNVNATKYAIETDPWFNQKAITTAQLILQNMLGKIVGPIYGMWLYSHYGQNGFVAGVVAVNFLSTLVSECGMPPDRGAKDLTSPQSLDSKVVSNPLAAPRS